VNIKLSSAETAQNVDEKINIIKNCEKIYPDLEKLGTEKFLGRYQYFTDLRSCIILYNDPLWYSTDMTRIEKFVALLDNPVPPKNVRDRFIQSQNIPEWIKGDAIRWQQGKEKDNVFLYGIRYMINSNIIPIPASTYNSINCENGICVIQNDFLKYLLKDSNKHDVIILTHIFQNTNENSFIIISKEVSLNGKTVSTFQVDKDRLVSLADQSYYKFVHKLPLQVGTKIDSNFDVQLTGETTYQFGDQTRSALLAQDRTEDYYEVIDKQTGIMLFAQHQDRSKKTVWTTELIDTNVFKKDIRIQYADPRIPPWFKTVVKWWTEGKIADSDYLSGISYLIKNNILQI
jgi:hypothetical protein